MQKFTIYGRLSGLNDYTLACRGNYGQFGGNNLKKQNENKVKKAIGSSNLKEVMKYPVKIEYRWIEENKKRDKDNIAFGHKFIQDALVNMCILENDTWKYIDKDNPRIEVTIKEFGEY